MELTPHEEKVLALIKQYPEIVDDHLAREKIAQKHGYTEKTLRNRIGDLKKYGMIDNIHKSPGISQADANLIDIFQLIWLSRLKIIRNVFVITIISIIIALIMPLTYKARAVIMPPSLESNLGFSSALTSLPFSGLLGGGGNSEAMTFLAILRSRKTMQDVVQKFKLIEYYNVEYLEEAIAELKNNSNFEIEEEGTISISVTASTSWFHPKDEMEFCKRLVADISNYFVKKLDEVNNNLKGEKAKLHRQLIEKRYNMNIHDLQVAEDNLNSFQKKYNTLALPEQTSAAIEIAATIKAQKIFAEVKYEVLKHSYSVDHPDIQNVKREINQLEMQLENMDRGIERDFLFPKFKEIPDLGIELARFIRAVEIQNKLYIFLTQQYEEAKIQEAKDTPTLQILDLAVIPEKKYKPNRANIVVASFFASLIFSIIIILSFQSISNYRLLQNQRLK
ncbi:MAG: hypothetical protein HQ562_06675 [Candidatus Marinimicrobia bacterium]|nr:hypothetical protein [Candidatus Neomarinimicrobiota bacterium]